LRQGKALVSALSAKTALECESQANYIVETTADWRFYSLLGGKLWSRKVWEACRTETASKGKSEEQRWVDWEADGMEQELPAPASCCRCCVYAFDSWCALIMKFRSQKTKGMSQLGKASNWTFSSVILRQCPPVENASVWGSTTDITSVRRQVITHKPTKVDSTSQKFDPGAVADNIG